MDLFSDIETTDTQVVIKTVALPKVGDYVWADGLIYRDPEPLKPSGTCGPDGVCTYDYLTNADGIAKMVSILNDIADNNKIFAIDFETSACKRAPVDPDTGEFENSRMAWSTSSTDKENGSDPHTSIIFLMAISVTKRHSFVVDVREARRYDDFIQALGRACVEGRPEAQNLAFEWQFVRTLCGVDMSCNFDTMVATQIFYAGRPDPDILWIDPDKRPKVRAALDVILWRELRLKLDKTERSDFLRLHPDSGLTNSQVAYVAGDTGLLIEAGESLKKKLADKKMSHIWDIEAKFLPILARTRYEGVRLDIRRVIELRQEALEEIEQHERFWEQAHPDIPINSASQLLTWVQKKYPDYDARNVRAETLEPIARENEDVDIKRLLAYKKVFKVESTYLRPWINDNRNPYTGNIHPDARQADTDTGRLAYKSPNLQNVSAKGDWAKIRDCFIADPGYLDPIVVTHILNTRGLDLRDTSWNLVDVDFSQFEVRALADMANETGMIEFFKKAKASNDSYKDWLRSHPEIEKALTENENYKVEDPEYYRLKAEKDANDFHTLNTIAIFGDTFLKEVDEKNRKDMRGQAKGLSFGIPYGISAKKVARQFKIDEARAQELIDAYYAAWPAVKAYLEEQRKGARYRGEVRSCFGRPRFFEVPQHFKGVSTIKAKDAYSYLLSKAEREATNAPIQGINGDVLKMSAILMDPFIRDRGGRLVFFVHDEILVLAPEKYTDEIAEAMAYYMKEAASKCGLHRVPIEVETKISKRWIH